MAKKLAKKQVGGTNMQGPISKESSKSIQFASKVKTNSLDKAKKIADYDRNPSNSKDIGQNNNSYDKAIKNIQVQKKGGSVKTKYKKK